MATRQKTVFNNSELCHAWAAYNRDPLSPTAPTSNGRNSNGSMFYDTDSIYSYGYHYLAARFYNTDNGPVVLINDNNYSNATAKHLRDVRGSVSDIDTLYVTNPAHPYNSLDANMTYLMESVFDLFKMIKPECRWECLREVITRHNDVAGKFGFKDLIIELDPYLVDTVNKHVEFRRRINDEKEKIKREKKEKAHEAQRILDKKDFDDWLLGVSNHVPSSYRWGQAFIRIKNNEVETSQGAKVPLTKAKVFARHLARGEDEKLIGQSIGYYKIDAVVRDTDHLLGRVKIGCHTISIDHILEVLKPLTVVNN